MKLTWIQALKKWNAENSGTWCVPRKGSNEHAQVKALMAGEEKKDERSDGRQAPATEALAVGKRNQENEKIIRKLNDLFF